MHAWMIPVENATCTHSIPWYLLFEIENFVYFVQTKPTVAGLQLANGGSLYVGMIPSSVTNLPTVVNNQGYVGCIEPVS